ncbi:hypothetical protein ACTFIZ_009414 [Dictyostelium cf. discoideum]
MISIFENVINDRSVNCGIFLSHLYKSNVNENHLKGLDLLMWNEFKVFWWFKNDHQIIVQKVLNKTMNEYDDKIKDEKTTHTVLFCRPKYGNLRRLLSNSLQLLLINLIIKF